MKKSTKSENMKRSAGGSATGGGINFQTAVTTIAYIYMARGCPLLWLGNLAHDVPIAIEAETRGAGDDLRLILKDSQSVEIQVKKGLKSGNKLWDTLIKLARAVTIDSTSFGLLIVSPTSSNTITNDLAKDIVRIGDGRVDDLSPIAIQFLVKLKEQGISSRNACAHLRIHTVPAMATNNASILAAHAELRYICADSTQIGAAWDALYADASRLIEFKNRRDISSLLRVFRSSNISLSETKTTSPALLLSKLTQWTSDTNATFSIFGVSSPLGIDESWIPLEAVVQEKELAQAESLADELQRYQTWEDRSAPGEARTVDPETLCRFITRAIVVAGPGMGKTTLLKRIARRYSEDTMLISMEY